MVSFAGSVCRCAEKEAQLDQLGRLWARRGQAGHGFIQEQDLLIVGRRGDLLVKEVRATEPAAVPDSPLMAGPFDENPAHGLSSSGEEMAAAVPVLRLVRVHEPQVRFVNQGRRLERLAGLLLGEFLRRQSAQLLVDQG